MALVKYNGKYIPIEEWEAIFESRRLLGKQVEEDIKEEPIKPEEDVQDTPSKNTRRKKS